MPDVSYLYKLLRNIISNLFDEHFVSDEFPGLDRSLGVLGFFQRGASPAVAGNHQPVPRTQNLKNRYLINQRWKSPIISVRLDFSSVFRFVFSSNRKSVYRSYRNCVSTLIHFLQNANLDTHICPDFLKCVYICILKKMKK